MKKMLVAVVAVLALTLPIAATATSGPTLAQFRTLQNRVSRLENQNRNLLGRVSDLEYDVFDCMFIDADGYLYYVC